MLVGSQLWLVRAVYNVFEMLVIENRKFLWFRAKDKGRGDVIFCYEASISELTSIGSIGEL